MRKVVIDRYNGKPLEVLVEKDKSATTYKGSQAERVLAAVNCVLIGNPKAKSKRKGHGILDKMTFVVIPNL